MKQIVNEDVRLVDLEWSAGYCLASSLPRRLVGQKKTYNSLAIASFSNDYNFHPRFFDWSFFCFAFGSFSFVQMVDIKGGGRSKASSTAHKGHKPRGSTRHANKSYTPGPLRCSIIVFIDLWYFPELC